MLLFEVSEVNQGEPGMYTPNACLPAAPNDVEFCAILFRNEKPVGIGDGKANAADWLSDFGNEGDPTVLDGWLFPIVAQRRLLPDGTLGAMILQSAGADNVLDTTDDLWIALQ